ncbi:cation diffusion facilitator family transporter [Luteipulveratus flavus]|uniref:cation diffusion facilitator family transporter n=1 Tax=Luteipulveratus flavus TaxID=3031728 RepID=UPI0039081ED9
MSRVPDACTLPTAERPLRTAELGALLERALRGARRDDRLRMVLSFDAAARDEVDDLVAREQQCCSFFSFAGSSLADRYDLEVAVPAQHADVVDGLYAQARLVLDRESSIGDDQDRESATPDARTVRLRRRARLLAATSVTYNVVEAAVALVAGGIAGSVALVGFGLDSLVEVSSGLIVLWQFAHHLPETRERRALRLMALSFFALAAYVLVESTRALVTGGEPESSTVGIVLAAVSLAVMPFLSWAQRGTGKALGSNAVVADSTQTLLCTYLSAVLLVGLVLNATLGWSWADPVAGLVIAAVAVREGVQAWRGDGCCAPSAGSGGSTTVGGCADGCCTPTQPVAVRRGTREER